MGYADERKYMMYYVCQFTELNFLIICNPNNNSSRINLVDIKFVYFGFINQEKMSIDLF